MPHTPPQKIKEAKKKGLLSNDYFFKALTEECGYSGSETAKVLYGALVRVIAKKLLENDVVRLPHIGDFALVKYKPRKFWIGKGVGMLEPVVLKFYANNNLRKYFSKKRTQGGGGTHIQ